MAWSPFVLGSRCPNLAPKNRRGAIHFKQSDDQKQCPDSEISDADSITAALVAEELIDQTAPPENLSRVERKRWARHQPVREFLQKYEFLHCR
jgi:hypothetical protein